MNTSTLGSSAHGIFQATVLERVDYGYKNGIFYLFHHYGFGRSGAPVPQVGSLTLVCSATSLPPPVPGRCLSPRDPEPSDTWSLPPRGSQLGDEARHKPVRRGGARKGALATVGRTLASS